ncbi:uncharacterized protein MELLADRAFT_84192 [Melampsora larici-populina 98AG31]|uniref:Uncharacterized protein n=1 Tax=Melampsora larici-populina (strain 98AG31 / pathotype 3-4-7) TaxID=747676 RepID=F4SBW7_MELLP|nr:uncharacterized protein MELLADRAFT_84192 [Melampsora larici-populina 98AG31]EGF97844.1 hypothetical protein MELLADRAFT_84192 [Melampsora larici-populina 98AG31]
MSAANASTSGPEGGPSQTNTAQAEGQEGNTGGVLAEQTDANHQSGPTANQLETVVEEGEEDLDDVAILEMDLRSETEDDTWQPHKHAGREKGLREDTPTDEEESLVEGDMDLNDMSGSTLSPPHGDRILMLQARIDDAYVRRDYALGADLLAKLTEMITEETARHYAPAPRNDVEPPAPTLVPNRQHERKTTPHRLIQENLSEFSMSARQEPRVTEPRVVVAQPEPPPTWRYNGERRSHSPATIGEPKPVRETTATPQTNTDEASRAKAMLESGKGRMILSNGDVIENGRLMLKDKTKQLEKSLPSLSPVLSHYLRTFKAYVPLPVFDKLWLIRDQQAREGTEPPSESKLNKSGLNLRMYGGDPPMEELTMQYKHWLDCFTLFSRYIQDAGWITLAENLKIHKEIVVELRETNGWMVALRYCKRVREGVMRTDVGGEIVNVSEVQRTILEEVKQVCDNFGERALRSNPYAPGGTKDHLDPESGLPRVKHGGGMSKKASSTSVKAEESSSGGKRKSWLPNDQWEAKLRAEGKWVEKKEGPSKRPDYGDRGRGSDRRENKWGRSGSRSPNRYDNRRSNGRGGRPRY